MTGGGSCAIPKQNSRSSTGSRQSSKTLIQYKHLILLWAIELLFGTKLAHCFSDVLHRILTESNSQNIAMKWASLHGVSTPHIIWKQTLRYRIASLFFSVFRFPFVISFRWGCVKILQIVEVSCWNMSRPHVVNNSCWRGFAYFCFSLLLRLIFFHFLAKDFKLLLWYWFRYV